jgi:hypothetical protein
MPPADAIEALKPFLKEQDFLLRRSAAWILFEKIKHLDSSLKIISEKYFELVSL